MSNGKRLPALLLQKMCMRKFHDISTRTSPAAESLRVSLQEMLKVDYPNKESTSVCIYKVPIEMRKVERKAYSPRIISIGPYHHGAPRLEAMEELKLQFFRRVFDPKRENGVKLDPVVDAMEKLELEARSCYTDKFELSSDEFVKMMLIDGCFIAELFRELLQHDLSHKSSLIKRWMLPTLRHDLIKLENQLPLSVLCKLFQLTNTHYAEEPTESFQELAIRFFNPLLKREMHTSVPGIPIEEIKGMHLLDLFRSSILPQKIIRGEETQMIRSISELKEAGIMIEKGRNCRLLDIRSEGRVLKFPPLYIDDYRGTLFRNMVAFEKCHWDCKPDVTTYLFFFDGLINSAMDVNLLHYKGILEHSLGSNREVAKLVNNLCKEVYPDANESYLCLVVDDANFFYSTIYAKIRSKLVHYYFSSWVVGISTFAGISVLYLTLIQTASGIAGALQSLEETHFCQFLKDSFLLPFLGKPTSK